jgi:hypothetical protein
MPIVYTSELFATGGTAIVSVSTFANLPATATTGQRISITGESSLFNTATHPAIVRWSGVAWQLESAAATYLNIAAVEFASGTWTGTGGTTVGTKSGALVRDITYYDEWVWNSTSNIFVPKYLNLTTVGNQQKIKGDSTTLEAGWVKQTDLPGTLVVDGGNKLLATAASGSGASAFTKFYFTDTAGTGTLNNFYMKCLLQRTTWTRATTGGLDLFVRHDTGNGGRIVEFGDADTSFASTFNGRFTNRATGAGVGYTATANRGDTAWQSETLVQFRVIAGASNALGIAQVKIGTGGWHDISVGTCRTVAGTLRFEIGVGSNNNASNIAACKLRYLQAIRYT